MTQNVEEACKQFTESEQTSSAEMAVEFITDEKCARIRALVGPMIRDALQHKVKEHLLNLSIT